MKKLFLKRYNIILSIIILSIIVILCSGCGAEAEENIPALNINDIRFDPLSFTGEIKINGVNVGIYQRNPQIFFLMDTDELIACKNMQCGAYQLPAIYTGSDPMPELADEVDIIGTWVEYEEDGQTVTIFGITKIEVKRNIMSILMS